MNSAVLTAYDSANTVIRDVDYIEVQWSRKWKEFGTWSAYMRLEDYNRIKAVRFVKLAGRPEIGVRMKTEFEGSVKGDFVTISGLFLHQLINWASSAMTYYITSRDELLKYVERTCGSFSTSPADQFVTTYPERTDIRAFWRVRMLNYQHIPSGITGTIEAKMGVADALMNILGEDCSFYANVLRSDYGRIGMEVDFRKGRDKTSLVFSRENGNVSDIKFSQDDSGICSTVRVVLETDPGVSLGSLGWDEYYLTTGSAKQYTGDTAKNAYVVHYDQGIFPFDFQTTGYCEPVKTIDGQTNYPLTSANWAKIQSDLKEQGKLEGLNHYLEKAASFKAIQKSGCQYLTNYDLGDTISIKTPLDSSAYTTRIVGVNEVHKGNVCEVELSTGKIYERRIRYRR